MQTKSQDKSQINTVIFYNKQSRSNSVWMIILTPNNLEVTVFEWLYEHQTI